MLKNFNQKMYKLKNFKFYCFFLPSRGIAEVASLVNKQRNALKEFGDNIGIDLFKGLMIASDVIGDDELWKRVGSDLKNNKKPFLNFLILMNFRSENHKMLRFIYFSL